MKSQKTFSMLILTMLLAICTSVASAQDRRIAELKRHIFAQAASSVRTQPADAIGESERPSSDAIQAAAGIAGIDKKRALLGTWNVTLIFNDGSQGKSTLQVFPGRS